MAALTLHSPAKVNLFLAITGKRTDGFHDLVSVVTPVEFGDTLHATPAEAYRLTCDAASVPLDESNLITRAARAFAREAKQPVNLHFHLEKRVPMGAGLGGGSSNAVAALRALNTLTDNILPLAKLEELAATLGSDCVLFLREGPQVMRGRGERVAPLPASGASRLSGRRVLLFKPDFGINTGWAYQQMAANPTSYLDEQQAEGRLQAWIDGEEPVEALLFNNMENAAFRKFIALPTLLDQVSAQFGWAVGMSGSGSCCYALVPDGAPVAEATTLIQTAWGAKAFVTETKIP